MCDDPVNAQNGLSADLAMEHLLYNDMRTHLPNFSVIIIIMVVNILS